VDEALARLAARGRGLRAASGFARVEAWRDGQRVRLQQVVLAERPARLRVETLSPFDQPISYLATDGERLTLYVLGEQRFLTGRATAANVGRLFPLALAPAEVVEALLGGLPLPAGDKALTWNGDEARYELTARAETGGVLATAWLRPDDLAPMRVEAAGTPETGRWSLEVVGWEEQGGHLLPGRVRFRMERGETEVRFRWTDVRCNPDLPAEAWQIEPPAGVAVEDMDGAAR